MSAFCSLRTTTVFGGSRPNLACDLIPPVGHEGRFAQGQYDATIKHVS